jgi:general stress protein 26
MSTSSSHEHIQHLAHLIRGIKVAMLTTISEDGLLRSRPMVTQEEEFDGTLWFFTRADAAKVGEVQREEQVNVSYAHPDDQRFVSVSGRATLVRDHQEIQQRWGPLYKPWFPRGPADPQLALLRVDAEKAEYWDAPSGAMVQLLGFARALATGQTYQSGENQKVDLDDARGTAQNGNPE